MHSIQYILLLCIVLLYAAVKGTCVFLLSWNNPEPRPLMQDPAVLQSSPFCHSTFPRLHICHDWICRQHIHIMCDFEVHRTIYDYTTVFGASDFLRFLNVNRVLWQKKLLRVICLI